MTPSEVRHILGDLRWMSLEQGERIRKFIIEHEIKNILELGFFQGVSTCYMAGALAEVGSGSIITIDKEKVRHLKPAIEDLLTRIGERERVTVYYEPTSYNWRLMRFLEEESTPRFDLCYIDGGHTWLADGFAFFLVDRLLKPDGWIIFDDLDWTYATCPVQRRSGMLRRMTADEARTPQIRKVYELLVKPHVSYDRFRVEGGWAFAHKRSDAAVVAPPVRKEVEVKLMPVPWEMLSARMRKGRSSDVKDI